MFQLALKSMLKLQIFQKFVVKSFVNIHPETALKTIFEVFDRK